jgi:chromatin segregation and condensation protein Rec8/ScpA/Scc1 (kleisin family)
MKKVDEHFAQKYDRRRNMTATEIKEEKEKKFLERQKERLFGLVDNLDTIKATMSIVSLNRSEAVVEPAPENTATSGVTNDVKVYRKRLMRWKNIGVWTVFLSVGFAILSVGALRKHFL